MNNQLKFSIMVMLILALFSVGVELTEVPEEDGSPGAVEGGVWATNENGITTFTTENERVYRIYRADGYQIYNPLDSPSDPFGSWDISKDWSERQLHDNLNDFYADISVAGGKPAEQTVYDLFSPNIIWGIILGILGATVALGVKVFGNGLSEFSQKTAFLGLTYTILWGFLTIMAWDLLTNGALDIYGEIIYIVLTLSFIFGVVSEVTASGE